MKYLLTAFFRFFMFASVLSCQMTNSSESSESFTNSGKEEVKQTLIDMWDAIEKEDIDRYASFIHPDFTQFGETDPILSVGKEAEVKGIGSWIKESSNIHT